MSVEIDPVELGFNRPFTREVSQILKIRNPNVTPVAFKVKTTAPKQYCVRPNSGRIEPGKEVEVSVLLQAMKQEPPLDTKCRDKFLVQSVAVTADKEFQNIGAIWQHVDAAEKSSVQEKKIRVVFLPADGSAAAVTPIRTAVNTASNGVHESTPDTAPPAYRSPSPEEAFTPNTKSTSTVPGSNAKSENEKAPTDPTGTVLQSHVSGSVASTGAAVSNTRPASYEDLKAQLAKAQATIASYGSEGGLRLRKAVGADTSSIGSGTKDIATRVQGSEGVPIQIVAALCLLSFLLAYLFF